MIRLLQREFTPKKMITEKERTDLIQFRLEQATNAQMEAQKLLENGFLMHVL